MVMVIRVWALVYWTCVDTRGWWLAPAHRAPGTVPASHMPTLVGLAGHSLMSLPVAGLPLDNHMTEPLTAT
jgi:hypothetical protein